MMHNTTYIPNPLLKNVHTQHQFVIQLFANIYSFVVTGQTVRLNARECDKKTPKKGFKKNVRFIISYPLRLNRRDGKCTAFVNV